MSDTTEHLLQTTRAWFRKAVPAETVTMRNVHTQIGVHFEEVAEMLETLKGTDDKTGLLLVQAYDAMKALAGHLKGRDEGLALESRKEFLDALCDQIVTAVGCAHMIDIDIVGGMREVNRSNWSKFVNGEPVFLPTGKIGKGPSYTPADLTPFV